MEGYALSNVGMFDNRQIEWSELMQSLKTRLLALAIPIVLTFLIGGCGSGVTEVTGKVTLDGKPIQGLEVNFVPKDPKTGTTATGYTKEDGTFELHYPGKKVGAPPGEYIVRIMGGETDEVTDEQIRVPAKYNSKSELSVTVKPGKNEPFNFELSSK